MEAPDEQLMTAYRDGDAGAFERLYRCHKGALFRFVLRGVSERPVAEELFQEIWMRVIEARERYVPEARFTTWLYTIAHHRLVDHWRRGAPALVALDEDPPGNPAQDTGRQAEGRGAGGRGSGGRRDRGGDRIERGGGEEPPALRDREAEGGGGRWLRKIATRRSRRPIAPWSARSRHARSTRRSSPRRGARSARGRRRWSPRSGAAAGTFRSPRRR